MRVASASLLALAAILLTSCALSRGVPETGAASPAQLAQRYSAANTPDSREALVAVDARQGFNFATDIPGDALRVSVASKRMPTPAEHAALVQRLPFLKSWYRIEEYGTSYDSGDVLVWTAAKRTQDGPWLLVEISGGP